MLELMVVLAIMAGMAAFIMPRFGSRNSDMKATVRKFSALAKQLQSTAKLKNMTYRLVIDMKEGEKTLPHEYWVEKSSSPTLFTEGGTYISLDEIKKEKDEKEKQKPPGGFEVDTTVLKKQALPGGLFFEDVEIKGGEKPYSTGRAYVHFLPVGMAEEAAIHIKGGDKLRWTVAIHPLTGQADVVTQYISLKEIREQ